MRLIVRNALVPFSAAQMFALVADVSRYPEFLPWCPDAKVEAQSDTELTASILIGFAGLNVRFATVNQLNAPTLMTLSLKDGPFSALEGRWEFEGFAAGGCEVRLCIEFEFSSTAQDALFGVVFEKICDGLIDGFVQRAGDLYADV